MNLDYNQLLTLGTTYGIPILKALAILLVGWVVAKGVSMGTRKVLDRTELDNKLAAKITGGKAEGMAIEAGVGRFVYWLKRPRLRTGWTGGGGQGHRRLALEVLTAAGNRRCTWRRRFRPFDS